MMDITPDTRITDLQAPVRYIPEQRRKITTIADDEFAIGTPKGILEEAASLACQAAARLAQIRRFEQRYNSLLMDDVSDSLLSAADTLAAIAKGMSYGQNGAKK